MTEQNMNPDNDQAPNEAAVKSTKPKRMGWILYIGIAFFIAIWTALGALFFLAVVWVLRRNPSSAMSFTLGKNDKKTAQRVYTWLFFSSFITVPIFIGAVVNASYNATINERVLAALIPLIMHAPLLLGLTSKSAFVYRHTQQGLLHGKPRSHQRGRQSRLRPVIVLPWQRSAMADRQHRGLEPNIQWQMLVHGTQR